jgi:hypothetical protein
MPRFGAGWRPGSQVIPTGWEAHHAPVPAGAMTAQCQIWRPPTPGTGTYDPVAGKHTPADHTLVWGPGPCRLQPLLFRPSSKDVGERQRFMRRYLVVVPLDVPQLLVGDRVTITDATDPEAVGLKARIESFPNTSLAWERDLICEEVAAQN